MYDILGYPGEHWYLESDGMEVPKECQHSVRISRVLWGAAEDRVWEADVELIHDGSETEVWRGPAAKWNNECLLRWLDFTFKWWI